MTFQEVLAQVIAWLQREQRVSYRALKRQLELDDDYLEDLKDVDKIGGYYYAAELYRLKGELLLNAECGVRN